MTPFIVCAQPSRFPKSLALWTQGCRAFCDAAGDLFEIVIGTDRVPIVVIIGVVSMLYTAYGGLYVSIVTDQWQVPLGASWLGQPTLWASLVKPVPPEP